MSKYDDLLNNVYLRQNEYDSHKILKELVERATPKAISWTKGNLVYEDWICPHCKEERDKYDEPIDKFCSNCGGALIINDY